MDASYINPFIQGTQLVFTNLCGAAPSLGKLFVKTQPYSPSQVSVAVSLIGDITGEVVFSMKESDGCFIASTMMFGMPVAAMDEMSQSAVSEMANMISGNVATLFSGKGVKLDISPPRFKMNAAAADFPNAAALEKIISVPLNFQDDHSLELDIMIK